MNTSSFAIRSTRPFNSVANQVRSFASAQQPKKMTMASTRSASGTGGVRKMQFGATEGEKAALEHQQRLYTRKYWSGLVPSQFKDFFSVEMIPAKDGQQVPVIGFRTAENKSPILRLMPTEGNVFEFLGLEGQNVLYYDPELTPFTNLANAPIDQPIGKNTRGGSPIVGSPGADGENLSGWRHGQVGHILMDIGKENGFTAKRIIRSKEDILVLEMLLQPSSLVNHHRLSTMNEKSQKDGKALYDIKDSDSVKISLWTGPTERILFISTTGFPATHHTYYGKVKELSIVSPQGLEGLSLVDKLQQDAEFPFSLDQQVSGVSMSPFTGIENSIAITKKGDAPTDFVIRGINGQSTRAQFFGAGERHQVLFTGETNAPSLGICDPRTPEIVSADPYAVLAVEPQTTSRDIKETLFQRDENGVGPYIYTGITVRR